MLQSKIKQICGKYQRNNWWNRQTGIKGRRKQINGTLFKEEDEKEVDEEDEDEENRTEEEEQVQKVSPKMPNKRVQKNHPSY